MMIGSLLSSRVANSYLGFPASVIELVMQRTSPMIINPSPPLEGLYCDNDPELKYGTRMSTPFVTGHAVRHLSIDT